MTSAAKKQKQEYKERAHARFHTRWALSVLLSPIGGAEAPRIASADASAPDTPPAFLRTEGSSTSPSTPFQMAPRGRPLKWRRRSPPKSLANCLKYKAILLGFFNSLRLSPQIVGGKPAADNVISRLSRSPVLVLMSLIRRRASPDNPYRDDLTGRSEIDGSCVEATEVVSAIRGRGLRWSEGPAGEPCITHGEHGPPNSGTLRARNVRVESLPRIAYLRSNSGRTAGYKRQPAVIVTDCRMVRIPTCPPPPFDGINGAGFAACSAH